MASFLLFCCEWKWKSHAASILLIAMTAEEICISAIKAEMDDSGYDSQSHGTFLALPNLGLELFARDSEFSEGLQDRRVVVTFEARAKGATTAGIRVLQSGFGATDFEAARDAAYQWCLGVYPALLSFLVNPDHQCLVDKSPMIVSIPETKERFGWIIHLPPILVRQYGEIKDIEQPQQDALFRAIFDAVHPYAAHEQMFWLECIAVRYPKDAVDATCRMSNQVWEEGEEALLDWAASWPDTGEGILSQRQFLLFEPIAIEAIPNNEKLINHLIEQEKAL